MSDVSVFQGGRVVRVKTAELVGKPLDWAVAKSRGLDRQVYLELVTGRLCFQSRVYDPSSDWALAGPIIEEAVIDLLAVDAPDAFRATDRHGRSQHGPNPRVAAMRCFVASKLGDKVDVPEDLLELSDA